MSVFNKILGLGVAVFMGSAIGASASGDHDDMGGSSSSSKKKHCAQVDVKVCFEELCTISFCPVSANYCVESSPGCDMTLTDTKSLLGYIKVNANCDFELVAKSDNNWTLKPNSGAGFAYKFYIFENDTATTAIVENDCWKRSDCLDAHTDYSMPVRITFDGADTKLMKSNKTYKDTVCVDCVPCSCE